jgi:HSP20 family protein
MDRFKKFPFSNLNDIEKEFGRIVRDLSCHRMFPFQADSQAPPATDIYETLDEFIIYMEVPGVDPNEISVMATPASVTITGVRSKPSFTDTTCIHQLEIEDGHFERVIHLSEAIDADATSSTCKNGCLLIRMPKRKVQTQIKVNIEG